MGVLNKLNLLMSFIVLYVLQLINIEHWRESNPVWLRNKKYNLIVLLITIIVNNVLQ